MPNFKNIIGGTLTDFLADITMKFDNLNLELQGPNKITGQTMNKIFTFETKIKLYIN